MNSGQWAVNSVRYCLLLTTYGILVLVSIACATETPTLVRERTVTSAPTKFARAVESPTSTLTPTPIPTSTPTITLTRIPSSTLAKAPTAISTAKAQAAPVASPLPSSTPLPTISVDEKYNVLNVVPANAVQDTALRELNITLRGFAPTQSTQGLVDYAGEFDPAAPQLYGLFNDNRMPIFKNVFQVYSWDSLCGCKSGLVTEYPVSLISLATSPGEVIRAPRSGYYIGQDFQSFVIYADTERIALNYTREANPIRGYTIYIEGVAIDTSLLALYQQANSAGRNQLPALQSWQAVGRAKGNEILVAIRDAGAFMDPRSRKDWWHGR